MSAQSPLPIRTAVAAVLAPLAAHAQGTIIPVGKYECWNGSSARLA